ncbi:MAG: glycosyltransferase [Bacteroidales bacterium]|nr:glycosyltransferase [Lachnoclostridium sp.]MCM1383959.1 glycosyltransferase [Lachnoclostridium sp.]MCM1464668.1 glycosyltransferase [Bacteroidales bacterium]
MAYMDEKKSTIGAICLLEGNGLRELSFQDILLDETLVQGNIWVLKEALRYVGGVNYRLSAKLGYELLVRIAREYTVLQMGIDDSTDILAELGIEYPNIESVQKPAPMGQEWVCLSEEIEEKSSLATQEGIENGQDAELKADCYMIGRYKTELLELGCFEDAVLGVVETGGEGITAYLEGMISNSDDFYYIYDCTQPILIYRGSDLCYNILDVFAQYMGDALEKSGQKVEYFDVSELPIEALAAYMKRRYKAVIGMQTDMFSLKWQDGRFAHDDIKAPKYQFVFDHPIRMLEHLQRVPRNFCVLTPDGNYKKFIENYYGHAARFLPPGGKDTHGEKDTPEYGLVFLGSYYDGPLRDLQIVRNMDKKRAYLLNRYILYMRRNLRMTPEEALQRTLEDYGISCDKEEFKQLMYRERWVIYCLSYHYRNKAIKLLLKEGVSVHVFGDTWKQSPMWGHPLLLWHEAVTGEDALEVYAKAKLSFNLMTWHKDGFTERIANAMLQKSVVVTDSTTYLEKNFENDRELLMFDLGHLEELPGRIKELLADEEKRAQMAECAYQKALEQHTWEARAKAILGWIEEDSF